MHIIGRETGFEPATYRSLIEVTLVYGTLMDQDLQDERISRIMNRYSLDERINRITDQDLRDERMNRIRKEEINSAIPNSINPFIFSSTDHRTGNFVNLPTRQIQIPNPVHPFIL